MLEQYRIADFLEWYEEKKLKLNPDFQRGSVWTPPARNFLIDTILRDLPIPKIYLRTVVDIQTKTSIREVVDGQQRLRTIIDFAQDKFTLSKRAEEFYGLKYSTLSSDYQEAFLSYPIAVDQLLNATDDEVLEVFARLNSYSVQLNSPEKRHARFQGEFKWSIRRTSVKWKILWDKYGIITVRQRVRMLDDSLVSEMYGVLLEGVTDGGQTKIDSLYRKYDSTFEKDCETIRNVDKVLSFIVENFADYIIETPLLNAPHFLMLFAAVAHALIGIPQGSLKTLPDASEIPLLDIEVSRENLLKLASIIESDQEPDDLIEFWGASKSSTQRISSRKFRFPIFYKALLPTPI